MNTRRTEAVEARPLDILGINETEERAYRWMLAHPRASVAEIARALVLTPGKTQRLLDAIEAKGLVTRSPERPHRYIPTSPDIAIESLALQHQYAVQRAQGMIRELQERAAAVQSSSEQEQMVELIVSRESERQVFEQIQLMAQHEVVCLMRLPMLISRLDVSDDTGSVYPKTDAGQGRALSKHRRRRVFSFARDHTESPEEYESGR